MLVHRGVAFGAPASGGETGMTYNQAVLIWAGALLALALGALVYYWFDDRRQARQRGTGKH